MTRRFYPNLSLAKRIARDIARDDVLEAYRAIQRRAPGLLFINARFDELSNDQYADLCFAIESEVERTARSLRLVPAEQNPCQSRDRLRWANLSSTRD
jgi:hypothetical protein